MQQEAGRIAAREQERRRGARQVGPRREDPDGRRRSARVVLTHVAVAAPVELDDPALAGLAVARELLVVDGPRGRDEQGVPSGVPEALAEVGLVRGGEKVGGEVADL